MQKIKGFAVIKLLLLLSFSPLQSALAQTSSEWTQTSQADFETGEGVNVDTSSSPGDIQLRGSGDTGISSIAAGLDHTVGLKNDGTVVAIGSNAHGQLNVSSWSDIKAVASGRYFTVGLKNNGTVVATGDNRYGQLNVSSWSDIKAVAAGRYFTVGLKNDSTVVATGDNRYGQLEVGRWTNIKAITAGAFHTVGLRNDGTVVAIGRNYEGQLNISSWSDIKAVSAGAHHTIGLKNDGTVVGVGLVGTGSWYELYSIFGVKSIDVSSWSDIKAIASGGLYAVGLRNDGTVVTVGAAYTDYCEGGCSGYRNYGRIPVEGMRGDIKSIAAGETHVVGLKSDGTVVAAGNNDSGQLLGGWSGKDIKSVSTTGVHTVGLMGDGTVVGVGNNYLGPIDVGKWRDIIAITTGSQITIGINYDGTVSAVGRHDQMSFQGWNDIKAVAVGIGEAIFAVGLKNDGTVIATGNNAWGQLNVQGWSDLKAIAAGSYHTVGLKNDGTVVATGWSRGQLNVGDWADIIAVAAGSVHTVGLKKDGTVWAVGENNRGQLNVEDWRDIVAIAAGAASTIGLKKDGTIVTVGQHGGIGDWTDIKAVAAGGNCITALNNDGTLLTGSYCPKIPRDWDNIKLPSSSGVFTSSVLDTGISSVLESILWNATVPQEAGDGGIKFQIATNNDNATWNFVGPDGTAATYYASSEEAIWEGHNKDRYLRYKLYISTDNVLFTPILHDVTITHKPYDTTPPEIIVSTPEQMDYSASGNMTISFSVTDDISGVASYSATLDGQAVLNGQNIDLFSLPLGTHTFIVTATDNTENYSTKEIVFTTSDRTSPEIVISTPEQKDYLISEDVAISYSVTDDKSGVASSGVTLDGKTVSNGQIIDLFSLPSGKHILIVTATDNAGNTSTKEISFNTTVTSGSLISVIYELLNSEAAITSGGVANALIAKLEAGQINAFINQVKAQSGKHINSDAGALLINAAENMIN